SHPSGALLGAAARTHADHLRAAEQGTALRGDQAAHALAMQTRSQLMKVEFLLEHLAHHWLDGDLLVYRDLIDVGQESIFNGALREMLVTDAEGNILFSSRRAAGGGSTGGSVAASDYFEQHARQRVPFLISAPLRNEATGEWVLQFSHAYYVNGVFAGVIVASVLPGHLLEGVANIYPARDNVVLMVRNAGRYLARSQDMASHLGRSVPLDREFITNPDLNQSHYTARGQTDGVERLYAWHRVPGYPVVLSLGLSREKALARTLKSIDHSRKQSLLATVVILFAAIWITGYAVVQHRQHRLVLQNQQRMSTLLRRMPAGVLIEDEQGHVVAANSTLCRLFGLQLGPARLQGLQWGAFVPLLDEQYRASLARIALLEDDPPEGYRDEVEGPDGSTLEIECVPIRHRHRYLGRAWFVQDITLRKQKERELAILASVDPLTGLLNRRSFMELL